MRLERLGGWKSIRSIEWRDVEAEYGSGEFEPMLQTSDGQDMHLGLRILSMLIRLYMHLSIVLRPPGEVACISDGSA